MRFFFPCFFQSLTNHDDTGLLVKQLKELETTNFIQPVCIESGSEKKLGYRRKLNVLHKGLLACSKRMLMLPV